MLSMRNRRRSGFSLLELVLVVVIIAIVAAIAIPKMSRGAKGADESALKGDLAVLRNAVELYKIEHGGNAPSGTAANVIDQLTKYTDAKGTTAAAKNVATGIIYGPYLKAVPPLPVGTKKGDATIVVEADGAVTAPTGVGTSGWWYNSALGDVMANLVNTETGDDNKAYSAY